MRYAFLSAMFFAVALAVLFPPNIKAGGCPLQQSYVPQASYYAVPQVQAVQKVTSYAQAQIVYPQVQAAQIQFQYVPIQQQPAVQYVPVQQQQIQRQVIQKQVAVPVQVQKQAIQKQAFVPVQKQSVIYPAANAAANGGVQQNVIIDQSNNQQNQRRGLFPLFRRNR